MRHLIWIPDPTLEGAATARVLNPDAVQSLRLTSARPLPQPFPEIRIALEGAPPDYFQIRAPHEALHVISAPLAERLRAEVPADVFALFPVEVTAGGAPSERPYFCWHLIREVNGLDRAASVYTPVKGWVTRLERLALDPEAVREHLLFRLALCTEHVLCAREDLAAALEAGRFTGLRFVPPELWTPRRRSTATR